MLLLFFVPFEEAMLPHEGVERICDRRRNEGEGVALGARPHGDRQSSTTDHRMVENMRTCIGLDRMSRAILGNARCDAAGDTPQPREYPRTLRT